MTSADQAKMALVMLGGIAVISAAIVMLLDLFGWAG